MGLRLTLALSRDFWSRPLILQLYICVIHVCNALMLIYMLGFSLIKVERKAPNLDEEAVKSLLRG